MKSLLIVANLKSHKTKDEINTWLSKASFNPIDSSKTVVIAPAFIYIPRVVQVVHEQKLAVTVGAQDVSPFGMGAYTGEVNASQLKDYVSYCMVGHSERRSHFHEDVAMIDQKIEHCLEVGITPIVCISKIEQLQQSKLKDQLGSKAIVVAYEPVEAIGSGHPDSPENANSVAEKIKQEFSNVAVLYGGSVDELNVHAVTSQRYIDGVLVGTASLDPLKFSKLIQNA